MGVEIRISHIHQFENGVMNVIRGSFGVLKLYQSCSCFFLIHLKNLDEEFGTFQQKDVKFFFALAELDAAALVVR